MIQFRGIELSGLNQQGFTLLEVLIALVVATVGLLGLSLMQVETIKGNGVAGKYTQATYLAQGMLERIKDGNCVGPGTFGFIDMSQTAAGVVLYSGVEVDIDESGEIGGPYQLQWQVMTHTEWSRRVIVKVAWDGISRVKRQVVLASVSRGGGK